jgi:predicted ribosomally synthesized peptide with SipW-like signal peptide
MSKGKSLPIAALFMVLVIALALLGVGYALWSDTLEVDGTVHTGEVDMAFSPCATNDEGVDPGYEKDVASCDCALRAGDRGDGNGDNGPDGLTIRIENGYPSYSCEVSYDMTNIGSIPVHLYSVTEEYDAASLDYAQNCVDEGEAAVGPGYQLHPGEHVYCTIGLHVRQEAEENATYTLHKEYWWGQYNEEPPPSVEPGAPPTDWTKAAGVRFKGYNTGGEFYLGPMTSVSATPRVELDYNDFQTVGEKTYQISFSHESAENSVASSISSPDADLVFDFDTDGAPGCLVSDWDLMEIVVRDSRTDSGAALENVVLEAYGLGDFASVDVPGTPGFQQWAVTGFDFSQDFLVTADLVVDGFNGNESIKVEFNVGCLP